MKMEERDRLIREAGIAEGAAQGVAAGTAKVNHLNRILIAQKRYEDLEKASEDTEYQEQLFKEFNI